MVVADAGVRAAKGLVALPYPLRGARKTLACAPAGNLIKRRLDLLITRAETYTAHCTAIRAAQCDESCLRPWTFMLSVRFTSGSCIEGLPLFFITKSQP